MAFLRELDNEFIDLRGNTCLRISVSVANFSGAAQVPHLPCLLQELGIVLNCATVVVSVFPGLSIFCCSIIINARIGRQFFSTECLPTFL